MPKINVQKSRIGGAKISPTSVNKSKAKKAKDRKKSVSPNKVTGFRQSERLQQKKITESWSGTAHKTKTWPENSKQTLMKTTIVEKDLTDKIQNNEAEAKTISIQTKNKRPSSLETKSVPKVSPSSLETTSVPKMSSPLDGLNREDKLKILRNFDLEGLYGPCRGISRRSRFQRAVHFNLKPIPQEIILEILESHSDDQEFERCIWDCNELLRVKLGSPTKK